MHVFGAMTDGRAHDIDKIKKYITFHASRVACIFIMLKINNSSQENSFPKYYI